jgi:hypothetical protein
MSQAWGCCERCRTSWQFVEYHATDFSETNGCFPLCEPCWQTLGTPQARLPYYVQLLAMWERLEPGYVTPELRAKIEAAVLKEGRR